MKQHFRILLFANCEQKHRKSSLISFEIYEKNFADFADYLQSGSLIPRLVGFEKLFYLMQFCGFKIVLYQNVLNYL